MNHLVQTWGYWAVASSVLTESFGVPSRARPPSSCRELCRGRATTCRHGLTSSSSLPLPQPRRRDRLLPRPGWAATGSSADGAHKVRIDEQKLRISRYLFDRYGAKGRLPRALRLDPAHVCGLPGGHEPDAAPTLLGRQRRWRHRLGRDFHGTFPTSPATPFAGRQGPLPGCSWGSRSSSWGQ